MSFSSQTKEELSRMNNLANKEVVKYELLGYLVTNHISIEKNKMKFVTENQYNINRFSKLISNLNYNNYEIEVSGKNFCITLPKPEFPEISYEENAILLNIQSQNEMLEKAMLRGAFLGSGSISNPVSTYHLEILCSTEANAQMLVNILNKYQITLKILQKKSNYSIYSKDGNEISKFLAFIQANGAVLKFEEIRVYRDVRNNVNRKVNCETANLNKTVNAAFKQIEDINYLIQTGEFTKLSKSLQEIANIRLQNPEASLAELGKLLQTPIGKSGVNHRLQAIQNIVEEQKKK